MFQNGIGTPKNLWFETSHDLFSLISYFDLQRLLISGGHDLQDHLRSKRGLRMESKHQKNYDLIPHMAHFHWFHILTIFWSLITKNVKTCLINLKQVNYREISGIFLYFLNSWRSKWRLMTSDLKFSSWSMHSAACTKFGVTKCENAPPLIHVNATINATSQKSHF